MSKDRNNCKIQDPKFKLNNIFIIEFKVNQNAKTAIQQIREKKYAEKYKTDKRPVILLGINFSPENKRIDDFLVEGYVN